MKPGLMLAPHPSSAVEYWFFKVNSGSTAILVDWIARRRSQENWLRLSIHAGPRREVLFEQQAAAMSPGNFINSHHSVGTIADVAWDLTIDPGPDWIHPDIFPAGLLRLADLSLVSAPLSLFTGWIRHGAAHITLDRARGVVSHYWGRQLASEWWWISASQFDAPGVAVECSLLRTSLWGTSVYIPLAYLYLDQPSGSRLIVLPPGRAIATGSPESFEICLRPFGASPITLSATGRNYGDLGDGILNTLVGDLEIREGNRLIGRALGTAGLERRSPR